MPEKQNSTILLVGDNCCYFYRNQHFRP